MKPILFSTPMVQAILAGRKTQTRRIVKPQLKDCGPDHNQYPEAYWKNEPAQFKPGYYEGEHVYFNCPLCGNGVEGGKGIKCPYGRKDGVLWVRETWSWDWKSYPEREEKFYYYKATTDNSFLASGEKWKPSIHMPKSVCRLFLRITDIRIERLQDITEADAKAEGLEYDYSEGIQFKNYFPGCDTFEYGSSVDSFKSLWAVINGIESWNVNPWVWVINFERTQSTTNQ